MDFSILGSIEAWSGNRRMEIRGEFQTALLGALLVAGGRLVQTDALFSELWGQQPPRNAPNALQAHVSRLRRKLDQLDLDSPQSRLFSSASGYRLLVSEDELDAARFMRVLTEVRAAGTPPAETVRRLRVALALWRGRAFGGIATGPICQSAAVRYEEARTAALGLLYDAELAIGRHAEIVGELVELVETESFNERLCEQLMVALYRAGRQTDALVIYRRMRDRLADELGIEPSPSLRSFERAILTQDPVLAAHRDHVDVRY